MHAGLEYLLMGGRTPCSGWKKSGMQFLHRRSERVRLHTLRLGFLRLPWWLLHRWVCGDVNVGRADVRAVVMDGKGPMGGGGGAKTLCGHVCLPLRLQGLHALHLHRHSYDVTRTSYIKKECRGITRLSVYIKLIELRLLSLRAFRSE